ncbi:MAG: hypothetical protein HLUCCA11_11785 [Phormidesmis priestleyi Ana]|uniref:Uncharacterized protein n=1 Tax=Phormidesmis priestleyi Ana TaxID=1666911 RepID=A0A0P7YWB5_9CYAN|nr:MAG: hypothetical protein HLUCCA11_11785 [Phormidesmis priestleyi Ana]
MNFVARFCPSKLRLMTSTAVCALIAAGSLIAPAAAQDRTAWLKDNETTTMTGYLLPGENIYGLCDTDCSDMDLFLYNEMGVMVDSNTLDGAFPIVTAPYEGTFVIEIAVPSCTHGAGCSVSISSDQGF